MDSGIRRNDGGFPASRGFSNSPESGGAAVDFTGFRFDPRLFLREDEANDKQPFPTFHGE